MIKKAETVDFRQYIQMRREPCRPGREEPLKGARALARRQGKAEINGAEGLPPDAAADSPKGGGE